jgi:hypothetical protein
VCLRILHGIRVTDSGKATPHSAALQCCGRVFWALAAKLLAVPTRNTSLASSLNCWRISDTLKKTLPSVDQILELADLFE